jgi:hypothetical protein
MTNQEEMLFNAFRALTDESREFHLYLIRCEAEREKAKKPRFPRLKLIRGGNQPQHGKSIN